MASEPKAVEPGQGRGRRRTSTTAILTIGILRLATAAGLAVDAYIHADLAENFDPIKATISQGMLFRAEAAAAALGALLVLAVGTRRIVWAYAFVVAAAGVGAVLLYRYVDVGTLGPVPNMYDPTWYPEKTASAIAEAAAAITAAIGVLIVRGRGGRAWRRRSRRQ